MGTSAWKEEALKEYGQKLCAGLNITWPPEDFFWEKDPYVECHRLYVNKNAVGTVSFKEVEMLANDLYTAAAINVPPAKAKLEPTPLKPQLWSYYEDGKPSADPHECRHIHSIRDLYKQSPKEAGKSGT